MFSLLPLNVVERCCDQALGRHFGGLCVGACVIMETIRPDQTDPIPLRQAPQRMGTIMIRFVGLLLVAIVVLALIWSR